MISKTGVRRSSVQSRAGMPARILGPGRAGVKVRAAVKIAPVRALLLLGLAVAVLLRGAHAVDDRRPLRRAGQRPLRGRAVREGDGRGPPVPVQRGRGADHRARRASCTRRSSRSPTPPARAARRSSPSRCSSARRSTSPRSRSRRAWPRASPAPREGLLAGALVALGGPVVWGYLYGSDIALFLFLALLLLDRWLAWWDGGTAAGLAAAGVARVARPAGGPRPSPSSSAPASLRAVPTAAASRRERLLPWLPAAGGCSVLVLLQRAVTGVLARARRSAKSRCCRTTARWRRVAVASKYGVDVLRGLLLGLYPSEVPIGFSQGQAAFVFPPLAPRPRPARGGEGDATRCVARLRIWLAPVALVFALAGPNVFMGVHFNRYLMWAFPGLLAFAAAGLGAATRLVARDDARARARRSSAAAAGLFVAARRCSRRRASPPSTRRWRGETWRREVPMAAWIRAKPAAGRRRSRTPRRASST